MPVECPSGRLKLRQQFSHLEAVGRVLSGIAPWLELKDVTSQEATLQAEIGGLARRGLAMGTDPASPDYLNFTTGDQPLVDAAHLAHAILRAPTALWKSLDDVTRKNIITALRATRMHQPHFNNWLLFSAMIEAVLFQIGEEWNSQRIDNILSQFEQWYRGDGVYSDGPLLRWNYYNSLVIHPMLLDVMQAITPRHPAWNDANDQCLQRAQRYAEILERQIAPGGTFPAVGRSLTYRFGVFHLLAQLALRHQLPARISPAQTRCALTAVMRRTMEAPGTFDANGWLTVGLCGHQPSLAEPYISTGSLYECCLGLLPLGLPATDEFWSAPPADWTSRQIWSGTDSPADHAL